jgi:hypothetical protein
VPITKFKLHSAPKTLSSQTVLREAGILTVERRFAPSLTILVSFLLDGACSCLSVIHELISNLPGIWLMLTPAATNEHILRALAVPNTYGREREDERRM